MPGAGGDGKGDASGLAPPILDDAKPRTLHEYKLRPSTHHDDLISPAIGSGRCSHRTLPLEALIAVSASRRSDLVLLGLGCITRTLFEVTTRYARRLVHTRPHRRRLSPGSGPPRASSITLSMLSVNVRHSGHHCPPLAAIVYLAVCLSAVAKMAVLVGI
ncbi:unnamed protein product [Parajaminaea phylloscopi]